jgi:hypothetical protein
MNDTSGERVKEEKGRRHSKTLDLPSGPGTNLWQSMLNEVA